MGQKFRIASGVSGVAFVVLIVIAFIFGPSDPPGFNDTTGLIATYVVDNRSEFELVLALTLAAAPFFLLFSAGLVRTLRLAEEEGPAMMASVAYAGAVLFIGLAAIGAGIQWASAHAVELAPDVVRALWEAGAIAYVIALGVGFVALTGATAVISLAHGALPKILVGVFSALLAAYTFVVAIIGAVADTGAFASTDGELAGLAFGLFLVWVLVVSAVLILSKEKASA
ncbi:MAG: hypothetical protein ACR2N5_03510 [Solirubrobacterales bacterium]